MVDSIKPYFEKSIGNINCNAISSGLTGYSNKMAMYEKIIRITKLPHKSSIITARPKPTYSRGFQKRISISGYLHHSGMPNGQIENKQHRRKHQDAIDGSLISSRFQAFWNMKEQKAKCGQQKPEKLPANIIFRLYLTTLGNNCINCLNAHILLSFNSYSSADRDKRLQISFYLYSPFIRLSDRKIAHPNRITFLNMMYYQRFVQYFFKFCLI